MMELKSNQVIHIHKTHTYTPQANHTTTLYAFLYIKYVNDTIRLDSDSFGSLKKTTSSRHKKEKHIDCIYNSALRDIIQLSNEIL